MKDKNENGRGYSTVVEDEGVNYREIAEIMTMMGFSMNHSSARNHVLRTMKKFCEAFLDEWDVTVTEDRMLTIVKDPGFQHGVADLLHMVEAERRSG